VKSVCLEYADVGEISNLKMLNKQCSVNFGRG